jgi:APA family basic amino acid/polyamine antiporter
LTGTFEELTSLFLFATWIFYALAVAAMIRLRRTEPALERPYRCWGYPWVPAAFLAGAAALTVTLWLASPVRSSIGLVLILSGLIFYSHWKKKLAAHP